VPPSINKKTGEQIPLGLPRGGDKGQHPNAFNSMTLQLGPLLPNGALRARALHQLPLHAGCCLASGDSMLVCCLLTASLLHAGRPVLMCRNRSGKTCPPLPGLPPLATQQ
jgi:hypothetical protein